MSGAPRVRAVTVSDSEGRSFFRHTGNRTGSLSAKNSASKILRKVEKSAKDLTMTEEKKATHSTTVNDASLQLRTVGVSSVLCRHEQLLHSNPSPNASCSSDASTDSFRSRASSGRLNRSYSVDSRKKSCGSKPRSVVSDGSLECPLSDGSHTIKRCAWVTPHADPLYAAFHDEEWGVPVHDDKKLFEFLVLSGALSELTWPSILSKRQTFREVFADFDAAAVSKFNEKKVLVAGNAASTLLSELKLCAIIENARQICKVKEEFGSFNNYIWSFVNHKPVINKFRYSRQVPVKNPKADVISKDLVRRGFRSVSPTVIYSFMQVAGLTNDHLISCFRFLECINAEKEIRVMGFKGKAEDKNADNAIDLELSRAFEELSFQND